MKFMISYFANMRNFTSNMIPISTAVWDPKWFHKPDEPIFKDRHNLYNGIKYESLVPGLQCSCLCYGPETCSYTEQSTCPFLTKYKEQLDNLDFELVIKELTDIGNAIATHENFDNPIIVLMVYETPTNPCSERHVLRKWFAEHGYELKEV